MTKEELKALLEGEAKEMFTELQKEMGLTVLNKDTVKGYLTGDNEGKSLLFSLNDTEYNRRFKKYKEEGQFSKDWEEEYQKKNPAMTEEQKKLRTLETELEGFKKAEVRRNNARELKSLKDEYGLFDDVYEMLIGEDLESSKTKITEFGTKYKEYISSQINKGITEKLGTDPKPLGGSGETNKPSAWEDILSGKRN